MNLSHWIYTLFLLLLPFIAQTPTPTPFATPEIGNPPPPATTTVRAVAWNPDGLWIARAFQNGTVDVINAVTNEVVFTFNNGEAPATALAWRPGSGSTKLTAAINGKAYIWDVPNTAVLIELPTSGAVIDSLDWTTANGDKIVSASYDGPAPNLRIWDAMTGQLTFSKAIPFLATASWNPQGTKVVIASGFAIETIDLQTDLEQLISSDSGELSGVLVVAWSPDGSKIADAAVLGQVTFWNASSGQFMSYAQPSASVVNWIAWSHDSTKLASASWDGTVRTWNAVDGKLINTIEPHLGRIFTVDWSPDDTQIVIGGEDGTTKIVSGLPFLSNPPPPFITTVRAVAWNPDGLWIARAFQNGTVDVINAVTNEVVFTFNNGEAPATALAWRPGTGSTKLAAAINGKAYIWDVPNTTVVIELPTSGAAIDSLDWTIANGDKLVGASFDGPGPNLRVWDATTGQITFSKGIGQLSTASWNSIGTLLVIGDGLGIKTVDPITGHVQMLSSNSVELSFVQMVAWSPDGSKIADGGVFGQVTFRNAITGEFIAYSEPTRSLVNWIAWRHDSTKLASASWDGTVRTWNAADGKLINSIEPHLGRIFAVDWSPDDTQIVIGGESGNIIIVSPES